MELFVSRGGFCKGGIEHCYRCGDEKETKGVSEEDIASTILSSLSHWRKWKPIPYDWHTWTEEEKLTFLAKRKIK